MNYNKNINAVAKAVRLMLSGMLNKERLNVDEVIETINQLDEVIKDTTIEVLERKYLE